MGSDYTRLGHFGRVLYIGICQDCGGRTEMPFKPKAGMPLRCWECREKLRRESLRESPIPASWVFVEGQ